MDSCWFQRLSSLQSKKSDQDTIDMILCDSGALKNVILFFLSCRERIIRQKGKYGRSLDALQMNSWTNVSDYENSVTRSGLGWCRSI